MQAAEMAQVLRTTISATQAVTDMKPSFTCDYYDATGAGSFLTCNSTTPEGNDRCAVPGVASCTLRYQDVNVTDLTPGIDVTVCNKDWPSDPEQFYKVAYLNGILVPRAKVVVPDTEAAAVLSFVQAATQKFDINWDAKTAAGFLGSCWKRGIQTNFPFIRKNNPSAYSYFGWAMSCADKANADGTHNVTGLHIYASNMPGATSDDQDPDTLHPSLDASLVLPLLRLQNLDYLDLKVGLLA